MRTSRLSAVLRSLCQPLFAAMLATFALAPIARAAAFSETFAADPTGGSTVTTFARTAGGVSFTYTFTTEGDGGNLAWDNTGNGDGGSSSISCISDDITPAEERITITRTDLADFTLSSIYIDNAGSSVPLTVRGYRDGEPVGSPGTINTGLTGTLTFGSLWVDEVRLTSADFWGSNFDTFTGDTNPPFNTDGTLTAGSGVSEPVGLETTRDTVGEAIDVFDFTLTDGGTSDGLALLISQVVLQVSGTSTDADRAKVTWRLNGPDVSNVTGTYNAGADTITFSGLSISVANGGNETYTVNATFNDNTALVEDRTIILSIDGDTHLTVTGSGTQMGSTTAVTNGTGTTIDVTATTLVFTTQPAGSVSGTALTTQPVVTARDAFGNTDVDFTETITLTEASAGTLSNTTQAATSGVATFTSLTYTATADQQAFTLTANDQDGVGSNLATADSSSVTSDVVATKLLFVTQPDPLTATSGVALDFTTDPVVRAADANNVTDTGYPTGIVLAEVNGAGGATMTGTGDTDGSAASVTLTPSSGVATFTGLQVTYTNSGAGGETFNLRASSGGLTSADSSAITSYAKPVVTAGNISISGATGTGGAYKVGDTITATWNNTAGGDNNAAILAVTVDFSQFGGGSAVAATNSSGTWTATYTIAAGAIDATTRNVSVTATNAGGDTTTADTANATVDNIAPTVTDGRVSIGGATGTGGAFKIGDTVTATWNNTAGGDNNTDTIATVTVDFTQFGGGSAVAATNSSGTWTATYTIVAGAIDATNRNVSITATDNAGNSTTTADTTNATVDSAAPAVTDGNLGTSGATGAGGAFKIGDTVTATWNNTAGGDNNADTIATVTVDFSQFGGGSAVAASNSSGTWTATYTIVAGAIDATNRNVSATATDNAGNATTTADTTNATVDNGAPAVTSVSVPANATYVAGANLDFTVNWDQSMTVDTTGGTPALALTIGSTSRSATFVSGSGTTALVFRHTVQTGDLDTDGIALGSLSLGGGTITDTTGNAATLTLNSVASTASVHVDAVAPTVSSRTVPADATYRTSQNLDFTVTYTENVTVNSGGGNPYVAVTLATGGSVQATYNGGTGTSTLTFRYTVGSGNLDTDGIAVASSITLNGGTIKDASGNDAQVTTLGFADTTGVLVDGVAPTVSSINRHTPTGSTTNATSVVYRVTFAEPVMGVDTADFTLTKTGTADGTVASISGSGAVYDFTVDTISGSGTLRLDLNNAGTSILDASGNAIATGYTSGQTYTLDSTAPTLQTIARQAPTTVHTDATSATWRVTFQEDVTGVDAADFTLTALGGTGSGTVASVTPVSASVYDVTVNTLTGRGALRLDLAATGTGIADLAGNTIANGGFTTGDFYVVGVTSVFDARGLPIAIDVSSTFVGSQRPAQRFTTAAGVPLTITSVAVRIATFDSGLSPSVTVHEDNAGTPGPVVGTLTNPAGFTSHALHLWSGNVPLAAGTTYWLVFAETASSYTIPVTIDTTGGTGTWLTGPDYLFRYGTDSGTTQTGALLLEIGATADPEITSTLTASGTVGVAFAYTITATNAPTSFAATGLPTGLTVDTATGAISGTPTQAGSFNVSLTATNSSGTGSASTLVLTVGTGTATVSLGDLAATYDGTPKSATATTTPAGLTVDVTYDGGATAPTGAGSYAVVGTVNDVNYTGSANGTLVIAKADQTVTFAPVGAVVIGTPVVLSATATSGLPVTYSIVSGNGSISGGAFTASDANPVTLRASQSGNTNYNAAVDEQTFTPGRIPATVTLGGLAATYDGAPKSATATTSPAGLTVAITYDGSATAPTQAGSYAVVATISDATHAGSASGTLTIAKADQTVTFSPIPAATVGTPVSLTATASSGLGVTFAVVSGDATVAGDQLTVNSAATAVTVRATQAGSVNFHAATADQTVATGDIAKLAQTITFAQPADRGSGDAPFALGATASSGLTVSFSIQSGPATVSGGTVTLTGAPGTVTVVASQAGDGAYEAAAPVTRSFAVTAPAPLTGFGPLTEGGVERGRFAAYLARDGASGTLIGHIPGHGGFVVHFIPDAHGVFSASTQSLTTQAGSPAPEDAAAAPVTWTFQGQLQGDSLSGSLVELAYAFSATFDPTTGPTTALSGYFEAPSLDTTTGRIHTIVGTTGTVHILVVLPDLVDGGATTIDPATGDFELQAGSGVVIDGNVDPSTASVDGTIIRADGETTTDFTGVRLGQARTDRLINLSSRARVGSGESVLITGFVIGGAQSRQILLRAVGPGLDRFDVGGTLSDPRLVLMQGGAVVADNDDWGLASNVGDIAAAFGSTGAFNLAADSRDAALLVTVQPGSYTVVVSGGDGPGVALAEIYDASTTVDAERLVNISARGHVGSGGDILIGGFIVTGNAPKRVLVRGVGPSLARYGVGATLVDPRLVVRQGNTILAQNDDWETGANTSAELTSAASLTSAFGLDAGSKDAALLITLAPGSYTAQVSGADGTTGIALVEVYELP